MGLCELYIFLKKACSLETEREISGGTLKPFSDNGTLVRRVPISRNHDQREL
jgi:hypothetical protein